MKNLLIGIGSICIISTAQAYVNVQMPFPVGNAYECKQNSDDYSSHGRYDKDTVMPASSAKYTKFDVDFATPTGTVIVATADGIVYRGNNPGGFGLYIKLDHGNGKWTIYAHLSGYIATNEQDVVSGQPIAFSGNTGNSTGPHLHFGIHSGSGVGISKKMEVQVIERDPNGNYLTEGWFATGLQGERRDFFCAHPNSPTDGIEGNRYARVSTNDHNDFSNFECYALGDNNASNGILCWNGYTSGSLPTCTAGQNHVRYYKSNGVYKSESITDSSVLSQHCVNTYSNVHVGLMPSWLQGGSGVGGGSSSGEIIQDPQDADISIRKFWIREKGGSYTRAIDKAIPYGGKLVFNGKLSVKNKSPYSVNADIDYRVESTKDFDSDDTKN